MGATLCQSSAEPPAAFEDRQTDETVKTSESPIKDSISKASDGAAGGKAKGKGKAPMTWDFIKTHMNEDHADSLLAYAHFYAGKSKSMKAVLTDVNTEGFFMAVEMIDGSKEDIKIPYDDPVADVDGVGKVMVAMSKKARDAVFVEVASGVSERVTFAPFNDRNKEFNDTCKGGGFTSLQNLYMDSAVLIPLPHSAPEPSSPVLSGCHAISQYFGTFGEKVLKDMTLKSMRLYQESDEHVLELGRAWGSAGRAYVRRWQRVDGVWLIKDDTLPHKPIPNAGEAEINQEQPVEAPGGNKGDGKGKGKPPMTWDFVKDHMNEDHADSLLAYALFYAGKSKSMKAVLTDVNTEGFFLSVEMSDGSKEDIKIPYDDPVADVDGVGKVMVAMSKKARDAVFVEAASGVSEKVTFAPFNDRNKEFNDNCKTETFDKLASLYSDSAVLMRMPKGAPEAGTPILIGRESIAGYFTKEGPSDVRGITMKSMRLFQKSDTKVIEFGRAWGANGRPYVRHWELAGSTWLLTLDMLPV